MYHFPNSTTNRQIFFLLFIAITSYATINLPKIMAESAGRISWIPILITALIFGFAAVMIAKLNIMNEEKVLFDYGVGIVGKKLTYLIAIFYLLYFIIIGSYLKLQIIGFLNSNFLPLTPNFVLLIVGITLFGYIANKGITNVGRLVEIIGLFFILITIVLCIYMIAQGMHMNILPLIDPLEIKFIVPSMKYTLLAFGGAEILFIIPFTKNNKKVRKQAYNTLIFIGFFYVLAVESTIMILGINNTIMLNDSFIEAIKIVELPVIERTDIFYLTFGLTSLFAGQIVVYTAALEFSCKIFPKVKRNILTIILCVIFITLCMIGLEINNMGEIFNIFLPYIVTIASLLIPTILFIVAKIKQRLNKPKDEGE